IFCANTARPAPHHTPSIRSSHVQNDGLWQLEPTITIAPSRSPSASQLQAAQATGSLPDALVHALRRVPLLFGGSVRHLLDYNFEPSLHEDICAMTGMYVGAEGELVRLVIGDGSFRTSVGAVRAGDAKRPAEASFKPSTGRLPGRSA